MFTVSIKIAVNFIHRHRLHVYFKEKLNKMLWKTDRLKCRIKDSMNELNAWQKTIETSSLSWSQ